MTVGVVFRPQSPPERLREVVEAADAAGVGELWLWEDCFWEGGLTAAAAALAWSERLRIGIGLLPVALRNPAVVAMEIATLCAVVPGPVRAGAGPRCARLDGAGRSPCGVADDVAARAHRRGA